jgi:hypothetical protein
LRHNEKLDKSGIDVNEDPTSSYCVVLDFKGQARIGIGDIKQVKMDANRRKLRKLENASISSCI